MKIIVKRVRIIGASNPHGRCLCAEFQRQGWSVIALVRMTSRAKLLAADHRVEACFAEPDALSKVIAGVTLVVSCLGVRGVAHAVDRWHIDNPTKLTLLPEAKRAAVDQLHGTGTSQVMHALGLGVGVEPQRPKKQENQFKNTRAVIPTA